MIAAMFHEVHFVEKWARGISLILSKEPTADFKEVAGMFITTFKRREVEKTSEKTTQKTTQKVLELIRQNPSITRRELAERIGISEDGIKFNLNKLKQKGLLKRIGPDKGGHWEIR